MAKSNGPRIGRADRLAALHERQRVVEGRDVAADSGIRGALR
jgi:hypothetical protein